MSQNEQASKPNQWLLLAKDLDNWASEGRELYLSADEQRKVGGYLKDAAELVASGAMKVVEFDTVQRLMAESGWLQNGHDLPGAVSRLIEEVEALRAGESARPLV